jgi:hypothetical protein
VSSRISLGLLAGIAVLGACAASPPAPPTVTPPPAPPNLEFAGLATGLQVFEDHFEFTDARGVVHAIEIDDYRQIGEHACCVDLVVIGADAEGPFVATFPTQGGLPDDCYVENDPGIDRGSHIEILGVLWRKSPGLAATIPYGTGYTPGTRFCFDEHGRVTRTVAP